MRPFNLQRFGEVVILPICFRGGFLTSSFSPFRSRGIKRFTSFSVMSCMSYHPERVRRVRPCLYRRRQARVQGQVQDQLVY